MPSRSRGSKQALTTKQRGYDHDHKENRKRLINRHTDGKPCWWCGKPMYRDASKNFDGHPLEAHHSKSIARHGKTNAGRADMLLHKTCNIQCGDGTNDHKRPTNPDNATPTTPTSEHDLGALAMSWPAI